MTETRKPAAAPAGGLIPPDTDDFLETLIGEIAAPVASVATQLSALVAGVLRSLLRTAYLRGRIDMLAEVRAAEKAGRPLPKVAMRTAAKAEQ